MSRRRGRGAVKAASRATRGGGREIALAPTAGTPAAAPGQGSDWFGPGQPLRPIAPPAVAGRRMDFQFGQNMQILPRWDQPISFRQLRYLADAHDLTRLAIETRKDQMSRLRWTIGIVDSDDELSSEQEARAARYRALLRRPDGKLFWSDWLKSVIEDHLVIDAPSIFVRRTMDGEDIVGLCQVDGATIMPLVDDWGRTPEPPEPAYQQILHGMPAVEYTTQQLVYRPRNVRVHTIWGFSPVEQIIVLINIALRRQLWQHTYFTDGNIPDSLIGVPSTWSPDQIRDFQEWFDSVLSGNTERRRGAMFVPGEVAKSYVPTKDTEMFGHGEEWIARVVCFCFSISHQALVKEVNRATADNAHEQALEDGLAPIMGWVKSLIDGILIDQFEETELEFRWQDDKELDPKVLDEIWAARVDRGMASRNEWRGDVGMQARSEPEADMLMASSTLRPVPVSAADAIEQQRVRQESGVFPAPPSGDETGSEGVASEGTGGAGGDESSASPTKKGVADESTAPFGEGTGAAKSEDRRYARLRSTRPAVERPRVRLQAVLEDALATVRDRVVASVRRSLESLGKSEDDDRAVIVEEALLEIGSWDFLIDPTEAILEEIYADTARVALALLGPSAPEELTDRVDARAVAWARDRAAELVGRRVLDSGMVVDNPDARWAISDSTRTMIRDTITRVLQNAEGSDAIIRDLEEAHAFSPARAEMVSRTEVAAANSTAAMDSYREARDAGVHVMKEWLPGPESCEECLANADEGPIALDDMFGSGDDEPPAHPNCECAVAPVVMSDGSGGGDDDGDREGGDE